MLNEFIAAVVALLIGLIGWGFKRMPVWIDRYMDVRFKSIEVGLAENTQITKLIHDAQNYTLILQELVKMEEAKPYVAKAIQAVKERKA